MHAIVMHQRGGPDVLTYETDFPDPSIGPSDVLIRVRACGMNRLDIFTREGQQGVRAPLPAGSTLWINHALATPSDSQNQVQSPVAVWNGPQSLLHQAIRTEIAIVM